MSATLADIRLSFRKLTAQYQTTQISDAQIDKYVNTYYLYDMPEELRLLELKTNWTFTTTPNVEYVNIDTNAFISVQPPVFVSGYGVGYFQNQSEFYGLWPEFNQQDDFPVGDGTAGPFAINLVNTPVLTGRVNSAATLEMTNVIISAQNSSSVTLTATDNGIGGFTGDVASGAINYVTGAITNLVFSSAIPSGNAVTAKYIPYQPARPTSVLFYRNQMIFRPIPDDVYKVTIEAFQFPTALAQSTDEPMLRQWWQLLAYGGAYKYFSEFKDVDNLQYMKVLMEEQLSFVERRTIKQISTERVGTIYNTRGYGSGRGRYYIPTGGI